MKKNRVDADPIHLIIVLNLTTRIHLFMSCSYQVIGSCQILLALVSILSLAGFISLKASNIMLVCVSIYMDEAKLRLLQVTALAR